MNERMADDEERIEELIEAKPDKYPVGYDEALNKFKSLATTNPGLWDQVNREATRPGGRPARLLYQIAMREHPELLATTRKRERESLLEELEREGEKPPKLKGGGGAGKKLKDMTENEIMSLSDDELARLRKET